MGKCEECEHWNKIPDKRHDGKPEQCNKITGPRMIDTKTLAYMSEEKIVLITRPNFGCVMFEPWNGVYPTRFIG